MSRGIKLRTRRRPVNREPPVVSALGPEVSRTGQTGRGCRRRQGRCRRYRSATTAAANDIFIDGPVRGRPKTPPATPTRLGFWCPRWDSNPHWTGFGSQWSYGTGDKEGGKDITFGAGRRDRDSCSRSWSHRVLGGIKANEVSTKNNQDTINAQRAENLHRQYPAPRGSLAIKHCTCLAASFGLTPIPTKI
jgi:hypothetical protein